MFGSNELKKLGDYYSKTNDEKHAQMQQRSIESLRDTHPIGIYDDPLSLRTFEFFRPGDQTSIYAKVFSTNQGIKELISTINQITVEKTKTNVFSNLNINNKIMSNLSDLNIQEQNDLLGNFSPRGPYKVTITSYIGTKPTALSILT